jgi:hypothetical protein
MVLFEAGQASPIHHAASGGKLDRDQAIERPRPKGPFVFEQPGVGALSGLPDPAPCR